MNATPNAVHHPADPDAAGRVTAYLDVVERMFPQDPDVVLVWDESREIKLTNADLREVLQQRADARVRAEKLAEKCATYRGGRDGAVAIAFALATFARAIRCDDIASILRTYGGIDTVPGWLDAKPDTENGNPS